VPKNFQESPSEATKSENSLPTKKLFDDDALRRRAEFLGDHKLRENLLSFGMSLGDGDAPCPQQSPSALITIGGGTVRANLLASSKLSKLAWRAVGDAVSTHKSFCLDFAAL
jgi:hypothetical protein